jgi:hypothetical protein
MYAERVALYRRLEEMRGSKVVTFVTGDRPGLATQIHADVVDFFVHHLDRIGAAPKLSLVLHTCGGHTLAAWSIVNLLRQFCDALEVIVPVRAQSSGTLICLGADTIVMTKQATLGPIDPSFNGALNPQVGDVRVPVSVEEISGFIEFTRAALGSGEAGMMAALAHLAGHVHPLVLGNAYRSRMQIRMLAKRLLGRHIQDEAKREQVLNFLCSDSGSHDYTIFRREARDELGLRVESPGVDGYRVIKAIYDDIERELALTEEFNAEGAIGQADALPYRFRRGLLESVAGGCHVYLSSGTLRRVQVRVQPGVPRAIVQDEHTFQGWRHEG